MTSQQSFLTVSVVEGKDLLAQDANGFSDPYIKWGLYDQETGKIVRKFRTNIEKTTLNPKWKHVPRELEIPTGGCVLKFLCYDYDYGKADDFIGVCFCAINPSQATLTEWNEWLELKARGSIAQSQKPDKFAGKRGSILVSFSYTSGTTLVNKTIIPRVSDHVGSHLRCGTLSVQISLFAPIPLGKLSCHVSTNTSQFLRTSFRPKSTEYSWDPLVFGIYSTGPLTNIVVKLRNKKKTKLLKKVHLILSSALVDGDVFTRCVEQNGHRFQFVIKYMEHEEPEYSPKNITERYTNLVKGCSTVTPEVLEEFHTKYPLAKNYHYHFVRGLFSSHYPGYFSKNIKRAKQLHLDCTESRANTDKGVEENAAFLRTEISDLYSENSKRVILIGHSKGGVDICAALQLYEDVRSMVAGVITLQSPWNGAPIVDWILSAESRKSLCKTMNIILFSGDQTAYMDLMVKNQKLKNVSASNPMDWLSPITRLFLGVM
eukprot:TRINITY_DN2986_c0_g1_i3.p1 TRINITY_DN2986_c0_g1~~TRINITY_DN2986_c0_g1_i3.p1  ORF type:complete len:487 (+),score=38.66 TRINITY_DN2986_c0_g1_i3:166-1626(+)